MSRILQIKDLGEAIVDALYTYTAEVEAALRKEVDKTSTDIKEDIQARAPVRSGDYRAGWKVKKRDTRSTTSRIIHNADRPRLPHLLEHGHAKRGGGRVPGSPHIRPAVEPRVEQMAKNIERIIADGG